LHGKIVSFSTWFDDGLSCPQSNLWWDHQFEGLAEEICRFRKLQLWFRLADGQVNYLLRFGVIVCRAR
jgi:hypothetical protein